MTRDVEGVVERDRPSRHGQLLGKAIAEMAALGGVTEEDMCATCAFREDCMTNQMAGTTLTAWRCAIGADPSPFGCHHGMADGEPTKLCHGWLAARRAPFDEASKISADALAQVDALCGPDNIRIEFDAWIASVDPDGSMNDYQRGRLWLRRAHLLAQDKSQ